jgi:tetratricopeptide (TPR) repeat protein
MRWVSVGFIFFLLTLPGLAWAQASLQERFQQGVEAFKAEQYQKSLELFQKIKKEQPTNALVNFYLGVNLQQLERSAEAIPYLTEALAKDPKLAQTHYHLGVAYYESKELEKALASFRRAKESFPDAAVLHYYEGLILLELDRPKEALGPLDKALELEPAFGTRVAFLSGVAYFQLGKAEEARKAFKEVQALEPESTLAANAAENLETLDEATRPPKRFSFIISGGFQYDDNVVLEPNGFSVLSGGIQTGPPVNLRIDDGRATASLHGEYRLALAEKLEAGIGYTSYGAFHANLSNLNLNSHSPHFYLGLQHHPFYIRAEYDYHFSFLGSDSSVGFHSVGPNLFVTLHPKLVTQIQFSFKDKTFFGNQLRYSDTYVVGGNQYFYILGQGGYLRLGYQYERDNARLEDYDSEANTYSGGLLVPLPWGLKASGEGSFERREYDNDYFGLGVRDEDLVTVSVNLSKLLTDGLDFSLSYTLLSNDANIGDFDYDQNIYGINLTYTY